MKNNPLAKVVREAFIKNVLAKPSDEDVAEANKNNIGNILKNKRIVLFENAVNRFLINSGMRPLPPTSLYADEKNLLTFSLQLSGYIRDAQKQLDKLTTEQACDPDLINLYQAAAKYSADCSGNVKGCKYVFREHCDYCFHKIHNHDTMANAKFNNHGFRINPKRRNLIVAMPFHINETQEELQLWTSKFLNKVLDDKSVYGSEVDVYLAHFPIEQPRGEKFAISLKTIADPENYYEDVDMRFVARHLSPLLGNGIKVDGNDNVVEGKPFDDEQFKENCLVPIIGYCAAGAHAHRWLNAFSHLAKQLYDKKTVKEAMNNILVINYAFLPIQNETSYSGVYFMSNYADDELRKEPFIKMFNPDLYEQYKCRPEDGKVRFSFTEDSKSYVVAFNLPEKFTIIDNEGHKIELPNIENGHHMGLITQPNAEGTSNYPLTMFSNVVRNASLGERGGKLFKGQQQKVEPHNNMAQVPLAMLMQQNFMKLAK